MGSLLRMSAGGGTISSVFSIRIGVSGIGPAQSPSSVFVNFVPSGVDEARASPPGTSPEDKDKS
jgi:hypothetical protein